jgi:hypothetical protein
MSEQYQSLKSNIRRTELVHPDWKIDQDGWVIQIDGRPTVTAKIGFLPPPDFQAETIADFMGSDIS